MVYTGTVRVIFGGGTQYTQREYTALQDFNKYISSNKLPFDKTTYYRDIIYVSPFSLQLRFLQSVKYDVEEAYKLLNDYCNWRTTKFPMTINNKIIELVVNP